MHTSTTEFKIPLPTGRMPDTVLSYCVEKVGGSVEQYLDNDTKIKAVCLGHFTFAAETNRELLENIFMFVHNLPMVINYENQTS